MSQFLLTMVANMALIIFVAVCDPPILSQCVIYESMTYIECFWKFDIDVLLTLHEYLQGGYL